MNDTYIPPEEQKNLWRMERRRMKVLLRWFDKYWSVLGPALPDDRGALDQESYQPASARPARDLLGPVNFDWD
jgi:hypothetical protein